MSQQRCAQAGSDSLALGKLMEACSLAAQAPVHSVCRQRPGSPVWDMASIGGQQSPGRVGMECWSAGHPGGKWVLFCDMGGEVEVAGKHRHTKRQTESKTPRQIQT